MAMTRSAAAANASVDAQAALCNNGYIRLYTTARPANVATAVGAQTLLAELRFGATAFGAAVDGVATANAITQDASANATGAAAWFRVFGSDGTTAVFDGSVTATGGGGDLTLANVNIQSAVPVSMTSFTFTGGLGTAS